MTSFHSEYNYVKNDEGECVPVPGTSSRPDDDSCHGDEEYWYERTAYRKISHSSCEGGERPDRGTQHLCPGIRGHSTLFWTMVFLFPFAITALITWWWYKKSGLARGYVSSLHVQRGGQLADTGVNSAERFDFLPTQVGTGQVQVSLTRWPPCPGSSLDWQALHTNMCPRDWISLLWDTEIAAATATCPSTRTRRYCGSRTRSKRESEPCRRSLDRWFNKQDICIFCSHLFLKHCRIGIVH